MRGLSNLFAAALVVAAFSAPAAAAGPPGGGLHGGGPPGSGGLGAAWGPGGPSGSPSGPHGPSGQGTPNHGLKSSHNGASPPSRAPSSFADHRHGGDWRHRPRHYWTGGPIFVPESSGEYVSGEEYYYDGSDLSGCWAYRKVYNHAGRFLGWVHVNLCESR